MLELRILTGLHRSASLRLDNERLTVGSDLDANIEILDPGIEKKHFAIDYDTQKCQWTVYALDGSVFDCETNQTVSKIGVEEKRIIKAASVYIGFFHQNHAWDFDEKTYLNCIHNSGVSNKKHSLLSKRVQYIPLLALCGCCLAFALADNADTAQVTSEAQLKKVASDRLAGENQKIKQVLITMLRQRNLSEKVTVNYVKGRWVLSGELMESNSKLASRMIELFSNLYPDHAVTNRLTLIDTTLPFKIIGVSSGLYAHVVTDSGKKLYLGDSHYGYTLSNITANKIIFKGEHHAEVQW